MLELHRHLWVDDRPAGLVDAVTGARTLLLVADSAASPGRGALRRRSGPAPAAWTRTTLAAHGARPGDSGGRRDRGPLRRPRPRRRRRAHRAVAPTRSSPPTPARLWRVGFAGFAPGFAYLVGGDPRLDVPRRPTPRTRVPAGSVGLAGEFSGIYPRSSPGGWQLIGRTEQVLWDLDRDPPALLRPGLWVQFVDVDRSWTRVDGRADGMSGDRPTVPAHAAYARLEVRRDRATGAGPGPRTTGPGRAGGRPLGSRGPRRVRARRAAARTGHRPRGPRGPPRRPGRARPRHGHGGAHRGAHDRDGRRAPGRPRRALHRRRRGAARPRADPTSGLRTYRQRPGWNRRAAGSRITFVRHAFRASARRRCARATSSRSGRPAGQPTVDVAPVAAPFGRHRDAGRPPRPAARLAARHHRADHRRTGPSTPPATASGCASTGPPSPGRRTSRTASSRARGWSEGPCRCRPTGGRWCSSRTTP